MSLETVWFILIAVLWSGYFVLEGFDFGVGMLLPVLGRSESDRSAMLNTIGPIWDGNEVWLIVAGGATFAAFPLWYATMFSGFYLALLAILVCLILRVVSFEWRGKGDKSGEGPHPYAGMSEGAIIAGAEDVELDADGYVVISDELADFLTQLSDHDLHNLLGLAQPEDSKE